MALNSGPGLLAVPGRRISRGARPRSASQTTHSAAQNETLVSDGKDPKKSWFMIRCTDDYSWCFMTVDNGQRWVIMVKTVENGQMEAGNRSWTENASQFACGYFRCSEVMVIKRLGACMLITSLYFEFPDMVLWCLMHICIFDCTCLLDMLTQRTVCHSFSATGHCVKTLRCLPNVQFRWQRTHQISNPTNKRSSFTCYIPPVWL